MAKRQATRQEATVRNVRASHKRDAGQNALIAALATSVNLLALAVRDVERRVSTLEAAGKRKKGR